jgi:hypothetical protein
MVRRRDQHAGHVQDLPERGPGAERLGADTVERVVADDQRGAHRRDRARRQVDQRRERDHRPAQHPEDVHQRDVEVDVELVGQAPQHDGIESDQPESAGPQVTRQLGTGLLAQLEARAHAGEQAEYRGADMRDPAREEQRHGGGRRIGRIASRDAQVVAHMIERHHDHHEAAQHVDRLDACASDCDGSGHAGMVAHSAMLITEDLSAAVRSGDRVRVWPDGGGPEASCLIAVAHRRPD